MGLEKARNTYDSKKISETEFRIGCKFCLERVELRVPPPEICNEPSGLHQLSILHFQRPL